MIRSAHCALLCQKVVSGDGRLADIIGVHESGSSRTGPCQLENVCLYLLLDPSDDEREAPVDTLINLQVLLYHIDELNNDNLVQAIEHPPIKVRVGPEQSGIQVVYRIARIRFPRFGRYRFDVLVDGVKLIHIPYMVSYDLNAQN